jgi:hypothetical protein
MCDTCNHIAESYELAAAIATQSNKLYCEWTGDTKSQRIWPDYSDSEKQSIVDAVHAIWNDPDLAAKDLHELWLKAKAAEGWTYGAIKDYMKKTHPSFVPWEDLPKRERIKDILFQHVVLAVLTAIDMGEDV